MKTNFTSEDLGRLESSLLGSLLLPEAWEIIAHIDSAGLGAEDFSSDHRRNLYTEIRALAASLSGPGTSTPPTPCTVTLCEWVNSRGTVEACGGVSYLIGVADHAVGPLEATHAIRRIIEASRRRYAAQMAAELVEAIADGRRDIAETTLEYSRRLASTAGETSPHHLRTGEDLGSSILWQIQHPEIGDEHISTGIDEIDHLLGGGLVPSRLYLVAGRPGHGKSALGLNLCRNLAASGVRVHFQSLEMSTTKAAAVGFDQERPGDLAYKLTQIESGVSSASLSRGSRGMRPDQYEAVHRAAFRMAEWPISCDDTPGLHYNQIFARLRRLKAQHQDLRAVVIDYIGLVRGDKRQTTRERIAATSNGLKEIAKELDLAVICLSQLNRDCEKRPDKRPRVDDLRDCGDLEQDADTILLVQRPSNYIEWEGEPGLWIGKGKDRHGPLGDVVLDFNGATQRIRGPALEDPIRTARQNAADTKTNTSWRNQ